MKSSFYEDLVLAIDADCRDAARDLFSRPNGFFLRVKSDEYLKIKGGEDFSTRTLDDVVKKPNVEYSISGAEFLFLKTFARGIGCAIVEVNKLFVLGSAESNFNKIKRDSGYEAHMVRCPSGDDITQILHAGIISRRQPSNTATPANKIF